MITKDFDIGEDCAALTCYDQTVAASFDAQHFSGGAVVRLYLDYISDSSGVRYHYADFDCTFNSSTGAFDSTIEIGDHTQVLVSVVQNQRVVTATQSINPSACLWCANNEFSARLCHGYAVSSFVTPFGGSKQGYVI